MEDPQPNSAPTPVDPPQPDAAPDQAPPAEYPFATGPGLAQQAADRPAPRPPADALPGDAAPTPILPLAEPPVAAPTPNAVIIRPPAVPPAAPGPRGVTFTLWMLVWVAAWAGAMSLTLDHPFDRKFDWNTSYFSIAARNLLHDGFVNLRGGIYLDAGEVKPDFYAGHPPLTAWLLAGWMKLLGERGQTDAAIRALPLAFTALNLILLYALVRRVFGAPAALATTVLCSLLPMTAYYAQVVNMEPFVLTFMLGASLGYLGWARSGSRLGFFVLCVSVVLGCWTDWPMYVFTGLLALAHLFKLRDTDSAAAAARRPVLSSVFLLVLTLAMFAAFLVYLKLNGSGLSELTDRAKERSGGAYHLLLGNLKHPRLLNEWFVGLFTAPALLLAALGALFWVSWSRRLSLASGEAARRAAFRIVLCLVLTQLIYTLAFPQGAWKHEFWQYYLTVPVALLAAAFCTWLTVVGGAGRPFRFGLADRAAWAVAALIPILGSGPFLYRMQIAALGKEAAKADPHLVEKAYALRDATRPGDVILTDASQERLGFATPWYAQRTVLWHDGGADPDDRDTHGLAGINKLREKFKGRRILYLWSDGDGPEGLFETLNKTFPQRTLGSAILYLIDDPDGTWKAPGGAAATAPTPAAPTPAAIAPPLLAPATTKPAATAPATRPTTAASTKPAP